MAGNSNTDGDTNLHRLQALRNLRPQVSRFGIEKKQAGALRVHHLGGAGNDFLQQFINVEFRGDRLHDLEERLGNLHAFPNLLVQHRVLNGDGCLGGEGL